MAKETLLGGIHDREGRVIAPPGSWVLDTISLSENQEPANYDQEVNWLGRLNWGYGSTGTIPLRERYSEYAETAADYVERSPGCHIWVIGNETNLPREWPNGDPILPADYAACYKLARRAIKAVPGHEHDQVLVAGPGPWNDELKYSTNPKGDWITYFIDVQLAIGVEECDGFAFHAYARGYYPDAVTSKDKMDWPFDHRYKGFLVYRELVDAILPRLRNKPMYLTEVNGNGPWEARGHIPAVLSEIDRYNATHDNGFRAVIFYRYAAYDEFNMVGNGDVLAEFRDALPRFKSPQKGESSSSGAGTTVHIPAVAKAATAPASEPPKRDIKADFIQRVKTITFAEPKPGQRSFDLELAEYVPNAAQRFGPDHHILVDVLDANGNRKMGERVVFYDSDGKKIDQTVNKVSEPYGVDHAMFQAGHAWGVTVGENGVPSDTVFGMGLGKLGNEHMADHVSYYLVFRERVAPAATVDNPTPKIVYVTVPAGAYIRNSPIVGDVIAGAPYREPVEVLGRDTQSQWLRVRYGGATGWMRADLVSETQPAPLPIPEPPPAPSPTKAHVPALAHPVQDPQYRRVTQPFGVNAEFYSQYTIDDVPLKGHEGVDFGTPVGSIIVAVDEGEVVEVADQGQKGYGRYVKLKHKWGETVSAHLSRQVVRVGDKVGKGDPIGVSGETGNTKGAHLHFGFRVNPYNRRDGWGGYEDPMPYLLRQSVAPAPAPSQAVIDPLTALAFLDVEGGNVPFVGGLLTIRFEVHMFRVYLQNDSLFDKHFKFVQGDYGAQYWRANPESAWMHAHGTMAQRHQALAFARSLNEDAALRATGMGLGQVMGSNHAVLGYPSPRAMFNAFAHREYGVNAQVLGFIAFVMADAELLKAIRNQDWSTAARKYNGVGQEALYTSKLNNSMDKIRREVLA